MYTVTATHKETGATYSVTTSILVWSGNMVRNTSTTEAQSAMIKALYLYNQEANEFFGK